MRGEENMRFIFGLDTKGDSKVYFYKTQDQMSQAEIWIVKVFLLVRSFKEDANSKAVEKIYILGGTDARHKENLLLTINTSHIICFNY